jgi:hypothetical protein
MCNVFPYTRREAIFLKTLEHLQYWIVEWLQSFSSVGKHADEGRALPTDHC